MSLFKRRLTAAALTASAALLLLPAAGQAAQVFGSPLENSPANSAECEGLTGPCTLVSFIEPIAGGGLTEAGAPSDGVITEFRLLYNADEATQVTFGVASISLPNPADKTTALASSGGKGPTVTLPKTENGDPALDKTPSRVPVKKGQHLAIDATHVLQATHNSNSDKFTYVFSPALGAGSVPSIEASGELLLQATMEPDADGDGFGDETQDQCPSQATTQGPCDRTAPTVKGLKVNGAKIGYTLSESATVQFVLAKRTAGRKVRGKCVARTARNRSKPRCTRFKTIGAGFSGPGKAGADKATLPNGRKLGPGAYRLTMTARDPAGNETTKTTTFLIKKTSGHITKG
jgi:hypothetical protein